MAPPTGRDPAEDRLDSWKEIAAYLDRDVRTVQRWEKSERLPVHRPRQGKRGSVWAFRAEIDAWWLARGDELSGDASAYTGGAVAADAPPVPEPSRPWRWRWIVAAAVAGAAALLGVAALSLHRGRQPDTIRSLAVLPLASLSGAEHDYLADGLTDAVITDLANIASLRVISRTSVMGYKDARRPLPEIARELGVDALVEGTVFRAGDRVRINAQLVAAHEGRHLWSGSYERDLRDVVALQGELARVIADQVRAAITPAESARLAVSRRVDPEAYQLYLRGRYEWARRGEGLPRALELYRAAVARDPSFAAAHAGLAETYVVMGVDYFPAPEVAALTKEAAQRALALDPDLANAHAVLGMARLNLDWDWRTAEADLQRALSLNPGLATAHQWQSRCLLAQGRHDEAIAEAEQAVALDPLSPIVRNALAMALCYSRRYERAAAVAEETLRMDPRLSTTRLHLGLSHLGRGDCPAAIAPLERATADEKRQHWYLSFLGYAYARCGRAAEARALLREMPEGSPLVARSRAIVLAGLGERDQALAWLEKAVAERSDVILWLKVHPVFDPLRDAPRFSELVRRVGLPPG